MGRPRARRAPGGVARAPSCAAASVPIMSSLCSGAAPADAPSAQTAVPVAATLHVAPIGSPIKRKRGDAAPSSSSRRQGLSDPPHASETPGVPRYLSIEELIDGRQAKIQRQRIEGESIHADLSKRMATGVIPNLFLKNLYGVGSGTSAARDGVSGCGNCLEGGTSPGTSPEIAGAANTALSECSPSNSENGAGPRVRIELATVVPNDPAPSQFLNTVAEVADVVLAQQQQQQQQHGIRVVL